MSASFLLVGSFALGAVALALAPITVPIVVLTVIVTVLVVCSKKEPPKLRSFKVDHKSYGTE